MINLFFQHEQDRDSDPSRFDTAKLEMIGREGLTCQELEDFFNVTIMEGATEANEEDEHQPETGTAITPKSEVEEFIGEDKSIPRVIPVMPPSLGEGITGSNEEEVTLGELEIAESKGESIVNGTNLGEKDNGFAGDSVEKDTHANEANDETANNDVDGAKESSDKENVNIPSDIRNLDRKLFWSTVAVGSFMLAASCIVLALNIGGSDARRGRRYNTRR